MIVIIETESKSNLSIDNRNITTKYHMKMVSSD